VLDGWPTPTASDLTQVPTATTYTQQLTQAVAKWQAHNIQNYRLMTTYFNIPKGYAVQREIIVHAGQVASIKCLSREDCFSVPFGEIVLRVEDFYQLAGSVSDFFQRSETTFVCVRDLQFDEIYGYIAHIAFDCENMVDDESRVEVAEFEILK
jgi:hypothetical protein